MNEDTNSIPSVDAFPRSDVSPLPVMDKPLRSIEWKSPDAETYTDVTDAIENGVVSSTPHPDEAVNRPKGYSVKMTLKPDSTAFAESLQDALLNVEPAEVTVRLDGVDAPVTDVPVGVSKVPHLGEQNEAELGVQPEGHDQFHEYF